MDVVVDGVSGDHQADGRDMQAGGIVAVGVPEFYHDQVAPFELDYLACELLGDHEPVWERARKQRAPDVHGDRRLGLPVHALHHRGRGESTGRGEPLQQRSETKEMVTVAVGEIDGGQVLAVCCDPLPQRVRLLDGEQGVDQDGVALAVSEGRAVAAAAIRCRVPARFPLGRSLSPTRRMSRRSALRWTDQRAAADPEVA